MNVVTLSCTVTFMRKSLSDLIIKAERLTKSFGRTRALDGFDLSVLRGEVHGFLGPNGAGKTTTIRSLLGQLRLDAGRAAVFGLDPRRSAVDIHARLSYVPGDTQLWPGLSGGECIDLLTGLHGGVVRSRRDELIERFELDPTRRMRTYSKGNRQKVALVAALATDAELLILDEPTSGLDPLMEEVFQQVIAERSAEGATVLLSSHILSEVETLCQRVTVIRSGRAVFSGGLDELRAGAPTAVEAVTARPPAGLEGIDGVSHLHRGDEPRGARTTLLVTAGALSPVVAAVSAADPKALTVRPPSLEEIFLDHYNGDRDDAPSAAGERVAGGE
ncbi:ABC transporter, ATP-binding protein [Actinomyces massiliensis F0489]|uniref:ABC transporter, ATP-binding protein n=2 Tax=Actinomyces TaxID=1654 RepID=J0MNA1_9ACTO|nr:ABC transporter, ATP-binding protein [Actinomyces massiliensis F0489]